MEIVEQLSSEKATDVDTEMDKPLKHTSGPSVTEAEKVNRAEEVAKILNDTGRWKSHARPINMETLEKEVRLKIEDYGKCATMKQAIRDYHRLVIDYMSKNDLPIFIHTRRFP